MQVSKASKASKTSNGIRNTLLSVGFGALAASMPGPAFAGVNCTGIPADDPDPAVKVCENDESYIFQIDETTTSFPKEAYRDRIRQLLRTYAEAIGLADDAFDGGNVTFWLSVPEASPQDAWARAIIRSAHHHFLVNLPIDLKTGTLTSSVVANLGQKEYPDYLGHRVGNILVKKAPKSSEEDFHKAVLRAGARGWGDSAGGWTSFLTNDFTELSVIWNIQHDPTVKIHIASAQVNEIFEWIAWRAPVFQFNID